MIENKFVRVAPDDPNRCQAVHANFQCPFRAIGTYDSETQQWEGPKYCARHGGRSSASTSEKREELRLYLSAQWKDRIKQQAEHPKLKSLTEEVGIIRMMINTKLESIRNDQELVMQMGGIAALINNVAALLKTAQHLEERSGQVLDRVKMNLFVSELITILERYTDDPEILQMIGEDIASSLDNLMKPTI